MNRTRLERALRYHYPVMDRSAVYHLDVLKEAAQILLDSETRRPFKPISTCGICYSRVERRFFRWRHVRRGWYGHTPKPVHTLTPTERSRLGWDK